jgi:hypothetical protein
MPDSFARDKPVWAVRLELFRSLKRLDPKEYMADFRHGCANSFFGSLGYGSTFTDGEEGINSYVQAYHEP